MKVGNQVSVFMGERTRQSEELAKAADKNRKKSVFAGDLNATPDKILQKRKEAQKKALKVVADTWEGDRKIDANLEERRMRIKSLREEAAAAKKEIADVKAGMEDLRKQYGVDSDSVEQKDLELILKGRESMRSGSKVSLSEDERERLAELDKMERTEYQSRVLEMDEGADYWRNIVSENEKEIEVENAVIREIRKERLKKDPMVKAQKEADAIEEAAGKEILGMLVEEGKEHIDEEQEEREEKAEETKEKKEEQEELLEKRRTEREEAEKRAEELAESMPMQELLGLDMTKSDFQTEIQNIVDKMKLVEEDIKGAMVDKTV